MPGGAARKQGRQEKDAMHSKIIAVPVALPRKQ
jgi:hypothetical protein